MQNHTDVETEITQLERDKLAEENSTAQGQWQATVDRVGNAGGILHDRLAVNERRPARQRGSVGDDPRIPRAPIVAVAGECANAALANADERAMAVVFDLVEPFLA